MVAVGTVFALSTATAVEPDRRLFVYGDSFAVGTKPFIPGVLPNWEVEQDAVPNRRAADAAPALRALGADLMPVVHLSLGTVDDPTRPGDFRLAVRRAMRAVGPDRCVVWTNIARPGRGRLNWSALNDVLADEARGRHNLLVVDWSALVSEHREWLSPIDATHVDEQGYRARAHAVGGAARVCRTWDAPRISRFYGITIRMLWDKYRHARPHFHALYGGQSAAIGLDGDLIAGTLPDRALGLTAEWATQHRADLSADWRRAGREEPIQPIDPLR